MDDQNQNNQQISNNNQQGDDQLNPSLGSTPSPMDSTVTPSSDAVGSVGGDASVTPAPAPTDTAMPSVDEPAPSVSPAPSVPEVSAPEAPESVAAPEPATPPVVGGEAPDSSADTAVSSSDSPSGSNPL